METATRPLTIVPIPAFKDNYVWLLSRGGEAIVVDPGDAAPVERVLAERALVLRAILLTHHHADHTGGVRALVDARRISYAESDGDGSVFVYGPARETIDGVTNALREGDRVAVLGLDFDVLEVPGHTRGHIAYVAADEEPPLLFCGDTLFAGGCGRLFEGTPEQMHASLDKLAALAPSTRVYCAHEYTMANLRFAAAVEPDSEALKQRIVAAGAARDRGEPTVPSTIALERATNPFLRGDQADVRAAAARHGAATGATAVATFAALRRWKDSF